MAVYIEEQLQAVAKMCEALMCHIHFHAEGPAKGHTTNYVQGCPVKVCKEYMEALHQLNFGERSYHMAQLRGENERLFERIVDLEGQLGINQEAL